MELKHPLIRVGALILAVHCAGCSDSGSSSDASAAGSDATTSCTRQVLQGEAENARDLGGYPLNDGYTTLCRRIFRGGDLSQLSEEGCAELEQLGVKTVIDLREQFMQEQHPHKACVTQFATVVPASMPELVPESPSTYSSLTEETGVVQAIFAELGKAASYGVYIHDTLGRQRTSVITALVLLALGATDQTVIDDFKLSDKPGLSVDQTWMEAVLQAVDEQGGIDAYLESAGVTQAQLDLLRAQARTRS